MFNPQEAIARAAAEGPNMNEAQKGGGGNYVPPAEGLVRLRFVAYVELGKHEEEFKGEKKIKDKVQLGFEASGPRHPPSEDGTPIRFTIIENYSLNEKAHFYKLFKRMNHEGTATHMAQLLGQDYLANVVHKTVGEGDSKRTYANLRDDAGYTIRAPYVDDPESGERRRVTVDEAKTPIKCFLWNYASKEMWDSIFIDGMYDEVKDDDGKVIRPAKSKNVLQERIKTAINWQGSPMQEILFAGGDVATPEAAKPERTEENMQASADAKAGAAADPLDEIA